MTRSGEIMKKLAVIFVLICAVSTVSAESAVTHLVAQLRTLTAIEGPAVYFAGIPGRFSLLVPYFKSWATDTEIVAMLTDESPIVRVMGYQCALYRKDLKVAPQMLALEKDPAIVDYFPFGCSGRKVQVGVIVTELKNNPSLLTEMPKILDAFVEPILVTPHPGKK